MERKIFPELIKWKDREGRKPLLLLGVRQVGKTWLMKTLGQRCFDNVAYISSHPEAQLHGLRFSMKGYEQQSWMTNVPLYAISRLYPSSTVPWRCG